MDVQLVSCVIPNLHNSLLTLTIDVLLKCQQNELFVSSYRSSGIN